MSDKKNQANADSPQPKPDKVGEVEVVEVEVFGRLRRVHVEIRVPLGIAVSSAGGRDGTRIVLLGFVGDERQGSHGDDAVMNTYYTAMVTTPDTLAASLEPANVAVLNELVRRTGAVIVVSSAWKQTHSLAELREGFAIAGCIMTIHDTTPSLEGKISSTRSDHGPCQVAGPGPVFLAHRSSRRCRDSSRRSVVARGRLPCPRAR